jgi:hypothetical protein
MKREWYNYGPAVQGLSAPMLRERLPDSLRDRLLKDSGLDYGVCADSDDVRLVSELDDFFCIGQSREVLRDLQAEVDQRSLTEYEYYLVSAQSMEYSRRSRSALAVARTPEEYVQSVEYKWPEAPLVVRELNTTLSDPFERVILVSPKAKLLFEVNAVSGVHFVSLPDGNSLMQVLRRIPCHADDIIAADYDATTRSVAGPHLFGLQYQRADFGAEDLQLIDRIHVRTQVYRYRMPWLVASQRFVELCIKHKLDRLLSPRVIFGRGVVPVLVGRGRITSTVQS